MRWQNAIDSRDRSREDLYIVRAAGRIGGVSDPDLGERAAQDVGTMTWRTDPTLNRLGRSPLTVGEILAVGLPPVADGRQTILDARISSAGQHMIETTCAGILVRLDLRRLHQASVRTERRQVLASAFSVGEIDERRGDIRRGSRPRDGPCSACRIGRRRCRAGGPDDEDEREDQTREAMSHGSAWCKPQTTCCGSYLASMGHRDRDHEERACLPSHDSVS